MMKMTQEERNGFARYIAENAGVIQAHVASDILSDFDKLEKENSALRERTEKAERQSRCLAENLTESILAHALAPPSKITIDDLWSPDEWLERTKTGVVIL